MLTYYVVLCSCFYLVSIFNVHFICSINNLMMNVLCFIQFGIRSAVLNAELPQNSRLHIIEVSFLHGFYQIICNYKELNKWINEANNLVVAWPLSWVPFSSLDCLLIMYLCFVKALVSKTLPLLFVSNYWLAYASIAWIAISFLFSGLVLDPYCWETEKSHWYGRLPVKQYLKLWYRIFC